MQKPSTYQITATPDIWKAKIQPLWPLGNSKGACVGNWWERRGRKGTAFWSLTSANFRLSSLKSFSEEVCGSGVWHDQFFFCSLMDVQYEQVTRRLQVGMPTADMNTFSPLVTLAVQEKFHRRIQLQEGRKWYDALCPPVSLCLGIF